MKAFAFFGLAPIAWVPVLRVAFAGTGLGRGAIPLVVLVYAKITCLEGGLGAKICRPAHNDAVAFIARRGSKDPSQRSPIAGARIIVGTTSLLSKAASELPIRSMSRGGVMSASPLALFFPVFGVGMGYCGKRRKRHGSRATVPLRPKVRLYASALSLTTFVGVSSGASRAFPSICQRHDAAFDATRGTAIRVRGYYRRRFYRVARQKTPRPRGASFGSTVAARVVAIRTLLRGDGDNSITEG